LFAGAFPSVGGLKAPEVLASEKNLVFAIEPENSSPVLAELAELLFFEKGGKR